MCGCLCVCVGGGGGGLVGFFFWGDGLGGGSRYNVTEVEGKVR